jgi:hypothetical protein
VIAGWLGACFACVAHAEPGPRVEAPAAAVEPPPRSLLGDVGAEGLFSGDVEQLGDEVRPQAPQVIYRYKRPDGREVYTNILDQVPEDQRANAAMDLSRVSLNSELGQELEQKLGEQHGALVKTEYCASAREQATQGFLESLWKEYAPLLVCGGVLFLFLIFTPVALKRMSAPDWARTLTMAIPSLALAGVVSFSMMKTNEAIVKLRAAAKPCQTQTFHDLAREPNPIGKQAALVKRLRQHIDALDALGKLDGRAEHRGTGR